MAYNTTAFISLGSNIHPRGEYIKKAVYQLAHFPGIELGKISEAIESPPLAEMEGENYLNAVCELNTSMSAEKLLEVLMKIENSLGRERKEKWSSRTIDLDILLFGDSVIESKKLFVPHRQMHLRSFVLGPLSQIAEEIVHPVLHRSISELFERLNGGDFYIDPEMPKLVSVAGLIGVGKTTLANNLAKVLNGKVLAEAYDTNPYLAQVYAGKSELALDSQMYFLLSRVEQMNLNALSGGGIFISDYVFEKELIYAKLGLDAEQLNAYMNIYEAMASKVAEPSVVVYLKDGVESCLEKIHKRNRSYEQKIAAETLIRLNDDYERLFDEWHQSPVISISLEEFDCRDEGSVAKLADELLHYIQI